MDILCCADSHNAGPPKHAIEFPVAWLHAGDFYHQGNSYKTPKSSPLIEQWMGISVPIFSVKGNHDCFSDMPFFKKSNDVTGSCAEIAPGLMVIGIGWHGGLFYDLPLERDMQKVCIDAKRAYNLKTKLSDQIILLTHYPPWIQTLYAYSKNPEGWMFECVKELVDEIKPMVIVQGHVHELAGTQLVYRGPGFDSLIINPGPQGELLHIELPSTATFSKL